MVDTSASLVPAACCKVQDADIYLCLLPLEQTQVRSTQYSLGG